MKNITKLKSFMNKRVFFMFIILSSIVSSLTLSSSSSSSSSPYIKSSYAQWVLETIKSRNLVVNLGNGIKTNAQLTLPAKGIGPYPGVLLVNLGGPQDMNETNTIVVKGEPKTIKQFWQISQYLSER